MTNDCDLRFHDPPLAETVPADTLQCDQQEMRERYLEQQRRLSCPSCGEDPYLD